MCEGEIDRLIGRQTDRQYGGTPPRSPLLDLLSSCWEGGQQIASNSQHLLTDLTSFSREACIC